MGNGLFGVEVCWRESFYVKFGGEFVVECVELVGVVVGDENFVIR